MTDIGTVLEIANAVNGIKKVGEMVNELGQQSRNGHKRQMPPTRAAARKKQPQQDSDFFQEADSGYLVNPSEKKALMHYEQAKGCMAQLNLLQELTAYRSRVDASWALRLAEAGKQAAYDITSGGPLKVLHGLTSERVPSLEILVCQEIDVMADMQKHVGMAIDHSQATVSELEHYDQSIVVQFDVAKKSFLQLEEELATTQQKIGQLEAELGGTPKADPQYVPVKQELDTQKRHEKETINAKEIAAQRVVYTDKQSGLVQTKEDIVRRGLHQLKLVNDYVASFLSFVQHTRAADAIIPQLVETAQVVSESYKILSTIFDTENKVTTQAITEMISAVRGVNQMVYPNALAEVKKQKSALDGIERVTAFSEQASKLLRGSYAAHSHTAEPAQKQAYAA